MTEPAKFIHGDRVVYMIDVPDDKLDEWIENLNQKLGKNMTDQALQQLIDTLEKKKDDDS